MSDTLFPDERPRCPRHKEFLVQGTCYACVSEGVLPPSGNANPETSWEAARSMMSRSETDRARVLAAIESAGERGLTTDEIEAQTGLSHQNASARVWELKGNPRKAKRPALIEPTGERRKTRSGRSAMVWTTRSTH